MATAGGNLCSAPAAGITGRLRVAGDEDGKPLVRMARTSTTPSSAAAPLISWPRRPWGCAGGAGRKSETGFGEGQPRGCGGQVLRRAQGREHARDRSSSERDLTEILVPAGAVPAPLTRCGRRGLDGSGNRIGVLHMRGNTVAAAKVVLGQVAPTLGKLSKPKRRWWQDITQETAEEAGKAAVWRPPLQPERLTRCNW